MKARFLFLLGAGVALAGCGGGPGARAVPLVSARAFDLRDAGGRVLLTSVKNQKGGTCWAHGTMAALESNLLVTGAWAAAGESGEPALAAYHLDWWNGFNDQFDADTAPDSIGLPIHEGGDYRMAAAYLSRGEGAVRAADAPTYQKPSPERSDAYHYFYARDIEWLAMGTSGDTVPIVKAALVSSGAVATVIGYQDAYYAQATSSFYQPPDSTWEPSHAVTIVGWDDDRVTAAPGRGAWLVKNSWGTSWGEGGYFWVAYADKYAGREPDLGAVAFRNVEPMRYRAIYSHDYHGWRDTAAVSDAFNAFVAKGAAGERERIGAVSFYTASPGQPFTIRLHRRFENGALSELVAEKHGTAVFPGLHTVDLDAIVEVPAGERFFVELELPGGAQPVDRTSLLRRMMGTKARVTVASRASAGESFYRSASGAWKDLQGWDKSANFCIKALAVR